MTILIVHPEPLIAAALRERYADDVVSASCADEALRIADARADELDLVLLDLDGPGADGLALCRRLAETAPCVPILACAGPDHQELLVRALDAGAQDFIARPYRPGELAARIRVALRLREERRTHARHEHRLVRWAEQLEQTKRDLESTICIDSLTGIANRRHFENLLRAEWRRAARDREHLSLVMIDLDDFHAYNERYGHVGGDACLTKVAGAMAHALRRASDVLVRYGGEEFIAILPDTDAVGACVVAERLRACVEALAIRHEGSRVAEVGTLSGGVATLAPGVGLTSDMLIAAADEALFRAKREGRNCWRANGVDPAQVTVSRRPWPTCPVAVLDPILVQRIPQLLSAMKRDVADAADGARHGDLDRARVAAQHARRLSTEHGFPHLTELAVRIDRAIAGGAFAAVVASLDDLAWYLEHVQVVYRRPVLKAV